MIAYCGITCTECPAFQATQAGDEQKARETAAIWSKQFGAEVEVDDVWCDGCLVEGRKCAHCAECEIRACGVDRGLQNCAHCDDHVCATLEAFFVMVPSARETLDRVRASLEA